MRFSSNASLEKVVALFDTKMSSSHPRSVRLLKARAVSNDYRLKSSLTYLLNSADFLSIR